MSKAANSGSAGVVYVAVGESYVGEACESVASLKRQHPDLEATLFTDEPPETSLFTRVVRLDSPMQPLAQRVRCLIDSPYERTLALDTDTYICGSIIDLFPLLDHFDLAAAHGVRRLVPGDLEVYRRILGDDIDGIPASFTQLNIGALLFRKSPQVLEFFSNWLELYLQHLERAKQASFCEPRWKGIAEQPSFRKTLYQSNLRWVTLSSEYNCIFRMPGYVHGEVKILHGRHKNLQEVAQTLNSTTGERVFTVNSGTLRVIGPGGNSKALPL